MLTDSFIQSILPATRPIKKADGGGLNICVLPGGRREWRLSYRFAHKQKSVTGGDYPAMSIDRARVWREEMKAVLSAGKDPADIKRQKKHEDQAERTTFRQLAQEWMIAKRPGWSDRYANHDCPRICGSRGAIVSTEQFAVSLDQRQLLRRAQQPGQSMDALIEQVGWPADWSERSWPGNE